VCAVLVCTRVVGVIFVCCAAGPRVASAGLVYHRVLVCCAVRQHNLFGVGASGPDQLQSGHSREVQPGWDPGISSKLWPAPLAATD